MTACNLLLAMCSNSDSSNGSSSGSEQGEVEGLSSFMAKALRVVSAPDAFLHQEGDSRPPALPCFSFSKRGTLKKTMSRKRSLGRLQSLAGAVIASVDNCAGYS